MENVIEIPDNDADTDTDTDAHAYDTSDAEV